MSYIKICKNPANRCPRDFQIKNIQSVLDNEEKEGKVDLGEEVVFGDRAERSGKHEGNRDPGSLELHS
ncbi:hypothetical protein [Scytonema sp. HK-05]|uniref:hypothetical protein n=1 Tax=Scytonema sp. HK-05 TaxID=1137095 RepID=UPI000AA4C41E|nr:hypothetical protein [Scytonema sp. HK-05]